jgi:hypothetical protein
MKPGDLVVAARTSMITVLSRDLQPNMDNHTTFIYNTSATMLVIAGPMKTTWEDQIEEPHETTKVLVVVNDRRPLIGWVRCKHLRVI